ncbi:hypothetical protein [Rhodanobacter denitrificans]|uniref:Uncharacterized protein n=1 Tax=Rhodanobacter denitrificans TaxID=666685 RepID=M4NQS1_9GAMM|nr:hypothetical protein [Rhodanobacter denitrificans]AGG89941.1 hypothetical protein R2APBS1_2864 [Rhodanobacter denitrificans]UJM85336.1 hypothetical protein LRJ86_11150 [Rhodanobacter denitrificans]
MAKKISDLAAAVALAGTELMEVVQGGGNVRSAASQVAALSTPGLKNYLINGDFAINQRAFAGGALAAGVYGFDRWKAGTGGCNISLSAGVLTHTSGPLVQVIEAPNLAGKTITVSVDGLSGGNLAVNVEGVAGVIVASAGRSGASIAVPGTSTGNVTVTLTPASGAVTYKRVQVELGSAATAFEWRPANIERSMCERYYQLVNASFQYPFSGTAISFFFFHNKMRATPSSTITNAGAQAGLTSVGVNSSTTDGVAVQYTLSGTGGYAVGLQTGSDAEL